MDMLIERTMIDSLLSEAENASPFNSADKVWNREPLQAEAFKGQLLGVFVLLF